MRTYERPYLTFQGNTPQVVEQIKNYSFSAKYAVTNVHGISTNIMNMTMPDEIVVSFADFLNQGLITITIDAEGGELPLQSQKHDGFELYFVMNGTLSVQIEQTMYRLREYDALVMNQNCRSMIEGGDNLILITVTMAKEYLQKNNLMKYLTMLSRKSRYDTDYSDAEYAIFHARDGRQTVAENAQAGMISVDCKENVEKLLYQFHGEMSKKMVGYEQIVSGLLSRLFYSLTNENLYETERIQEKHLAKEDLAEAIKEYLDENPKKITVEELTKKFHYNRNYLSRIFLENINHSIKEYNNMVCMREAERLLKQTDLSVALIAERLGFMSRSQFYRVFREQFGCNPADIRGL